MKTENVDAVALKRALQKKAEQKLARLSEQEQLELLRRKYGHLRRTPKRSPRARRELQTA
ncbi:MAG: hypothetical protein HY868_10100 [Chloroflexi bacterium]|nr:hypothetical protein [Chloroflexota bacterium]